MDYLKHFRHVKSIANCLLKNGELDVIEWKPDMVKELWEEKSFLHHGTMKTARRQWIEDSNDFYVSLNNLKATVENLIVVEGNERLENHVSNELSELIKRFQNFDKKHQKLNRHFQQYNRWFFECYYELLGFQKWLISLSESLNKPIDKGFNEKKSDAVNDATIKARVQNQLADINFFQIEVVGDYEFEGETYKDLKQRNNDSNITPENWEQSKETFFTERMAAYKNSYTLVEKIKLELSALESLRVKKVDHHILKDRYKDYLNNKNTKPTQQNDHRRPKALSDLITHEKSTEIVERIKVRYKNIQGKRLKLLLLALQDLELLPKERIAKKFHEHCNKEFDWDIASYNAMNGYAYNRNIDEDELNSMKQYLEALNKTK